MARALPFAKRAFALKCSGFANQTETDVGSRAKRLFARQTLKLTQSKAAAGRMISAARCTTNNCELNFIRIFAIKIGDPFSGNRSLCCLNRADRLTASGTAEDSDGDERWKTRRGR